MKQKFKSFPKLLGILAFFMLTNCSKDEFVSHIKNNTNKKNNISFEQFKKETGLYNFSTTIHTSQNFNQSSNTARLADGSYELSDFDISTDIIKKLESTNITSYTFRIYPKEYREEDSKTFFNLSLYKNGEIWETTIIQFKPTELNYEKIKEGLTEKVEGKAKLLYKGDLNNYGIISGSPCFEVTIVSSYCVGCDKDAECDANQHGGCPVCGTTSASFIMCLEIGDGINQGGGYDGVGPPGDGIGPIGGDGNSGIDIIYNPPNSSSTTEPQNPIIPNVSDTGIGVDPQQSLPPCEELKKLVNSTRVNGSIKTNVDLLKAKVNSNDNTSEISFDTEKHMNSDETYTYTNTNRTGLTATAPIYTGHHFIGGGHNHPKQGVPMFSFEDVQTFRDIYRETFPSNRNEVYLILVCKDNNGVTKTYALKVDDYDALNNEVDAVWYDPKYAEYTEENNQRIDQIKRLQGKKYDKCGGQYEKSFLQQFGGYGISMYQATNEALTTWSKLELGNGNPLDPSQLTVNSNPCN